jgi:hypothetical protein
MSNLSELLASQLTQKELRGFAFHSKVYAIINIVSGIIVCLLGIPMLFFFGVGFIYIGLGAVIIWLSIRLLNASKIVKSIADSAEVIPEEEFNTKIIETISNIKFQYKVYNILYAIYIGLMVIGLILGILFSFFLASNYKEFNDYPMRSMRDYQTYQLPSQNTIPSNLPLPPEPNTITIPQNR